MPEPYRPRPLAPLHPHPVAGMAPPPSRRLPLLLATGLYVGLGVLVWKAPAIFGVRTAVPPTPPKTAVLLLVEEDLPPHSVLPPMVPQNGGGGDGGAGPLLLADKPLEPPQVRQELDDVDQIPATLPTEAAPLPVAYGHGGTGNGRLAGSGGGSGGGTGGGVGTGTGPGKQAVVLSIEDLDFENFEKPDYPKFAQDAGIEGEVMLHLLVDAEGVPMKVWATSGSPLFVPNTVKTAMRWRFGALRKKRIPAPAEVEFLFRYTLIRPGRK